MNFACVMCKGLENRFFKNKEPNTIDEKELFYHRYDQSFKFASRLKK